MFAIIKDGAHQYKVKAGDVLLLEKKDLNVGDKLTFKEVLLLSDDLKDIKVGTPYLDLNIEARVLENLKGEKIRVVKRKSKKRYERVQGHRQNYTKVEILPFSKEEKTSAKKIAKKESTKKDEIKQTSKKVSSTKKEEDKKVEKK
jgi:large subunit ribosomal protein L21